MAPRLTNRLIFVRYAGGSVRQISQVMKGTLILVFSSEVRLLERCRSSRTCYRPLFSASWPISQLPTVFPLSCVSDAWLSSSRTWRSVLRVTCVITASVQSVEIYRGVWVNVHQFGRAVRQGGFGSNGVEAKATDDTHCASSSGLTDPATSLNLDIRRQWAYEAEEKRTVMRSPQRLME